MNDIGQHAWTDDLGRPEETERERTFIFVRVVPSEDGVGSVNGGVDVGAEEGDEE